MAYFEQMREEGMDADELAEHRAYQAARMEEDRD